MPKDPVVASPKEALILASDYCSIKKFNKLDTLIFLKAMSSSHRFSKLTASEWEEKHTEFYSRKS